MKNVEMESLTTESNCSLAPAEMELKLEELTAVEEGHLERFDSVESFQTRTSTESYETVRPS